MDECEIEGRIKKSATKLFLKYGYNEVNMSQIAEASGISRPTLYYYFRSKDKIFKCVLGDVVQELAPKLAKELHKEIPLEEKISIFVHTYFQLFLKEPEIPMFMLKEINRDASHLIKTLYDEDIEVYANELIQAIRNEEAKGTMNSVPLFSIFLTFCGLVYIPFVTKDLVKPIFMINPKGSELPYQEGKEVGDWHVASDLKDLVSKWEPFVVDSLRNLLIKTPKTS
jgi:AcrR family transcriptional regulator